MIKLVIIGLIIYLLYRDEKKKRQDNEHKGPYGTGWTWNEETQLWEPPKEKSQIRISRNGPSYEEWKAQRIKEEDEKTPKNKMSEDGSYRFDYIHRPDEEPIYSRPNNKAPNTELQKDPPPKEHETDHLKTPQKQTAQTDTTSNPKTEQYKNSYEVKPILSYNESRNYKTLKEAANKKNYTVQIKMRLADIVQPRSGQYYDKYYEANFRRISQYHVDFTILNDRMKVVAIIELDDNSHDKPDRKERDEKVDSILKANGIKIIHTRHITPDILDHL